jgi:hypothetical protein
MIQHQVLHIFHDLCISLMGVGRNRVEPLALLVNSGGLGMQDKGNGQKTLEGIRLGFFIKQPEVP